MSAFDLDAKRKDRRKPEQKLNDKIEAALVGMDPVRIENSVGSGQPDVNFTSGWIESKVLRKWPVKQDTIVRVDHYTTEQRGWHCRRRAAGGIVLVVIQIAEDYLVFDGLWASSNLGYSTRENMLRQAILVMGGQWNGHRFRRWLVEYVNNS